MHEFASWASHTRGAYSARAGPDQVTAATALSQSLLSRTYVYPVSPLAVTKPMRVKAHVEQSFSFHLVCFGRAAIGCNASAPVVNLIKIPVAGGAMLHTSKTVHETRSGVRQLWCCLEPALIFDTYSPPLGRHLCTAGQDARM